MKKNILIPLLFAVLLLNSCAPYYTYYNSNPVYTYNENDQAPRVLRTDVQFFDFTKYIEMGFYISNDPYLGKYTPVGDLKMRVYPKKTHPQGLEYPIDYYSSFTIVTKVITPDELLQILYEKATELGANGVVNFKVTYSSGSENRVFHYDISGFAIKIED